MLFYFKAKADVGFQGSGPLLCSLYLLPVRLIFREHASSFTVMLMIDKSVCL